MSAPDAAAVPEAPKNLQLMSTSRAGDAGYLAARDLGVIAADLGFEYRLLGGNAVSLLVAAAGLGGVVPGRETSDTDFGAAYDVVADPRLPAALIARGYERESGNRFARTLTQATAEGPTTEELVLSIDVLAPGYEGRLMPNRAHGELVVDEIPGLGFALARPAVEIELEVSLTTGPRLTMVIALPDVVSMICLKAYAYKGRLAARDVIDIWRLLEVAYAAGLRRAAWPRSATARDASHVLHEYLALPGSAGLRHLSTYRSAEHRVRALIAAVVEPV